MKIGSREEKQACVMFCDTRKVYSARSSLFCAVSGEILEGEVLS